MGPLAPPPIVAPVTGRSLLSVRVKTGGPLDDILAQQMADALTGGMLSKLKARQKERELHGDPLENAMKLHPTKSEPPPWMQDKKGSAINGMKSALTELKA